MAIRVSRILGGIWSPNFGEGAVVGGQRWHHSKERQVLHCDRCAICNHSAAICDRMSPTLKSIGGGSRLAKISGCGPWNRPLMFASAESEHPRLTNVRLFWKNSNLCDHGWMGRETRCDGKTVLYTKVHRAVKTDDEQVLML